MGTTSQIVHPKIILFDGVCNLCNAAVKFIIKRDPQAVFKFASLQSEVANKYLQSSDEMGSVILIAGDHIYKESEAALKIARQLSGGWPLFYVFIIIPRPIRDSVYKVIARNRYKWFGKKDHCMVPTEDLKVRFLDS